MALYDAIFNISIIPNVNIIKYNGIPDHAVVSYINFFEQKGIRYLTIDDTSAGYQAVLNL
mgnify:CR=1 FL=1